VCNEEIEPNYIRARFKFKKIKKFRKRLLVIVLISLFVVVLLCHYFATVVNPIILSYGEAEVSRLLVSSANGAILNISSFSYDDLVTINYASNSKISSIVVNSTQLNSLANSLAVETEREIELNANLGISIPFGTITGLGLLSGKGSPVNLSVNPIGNVISEFHTSFTSAGINQTSHKIFVTISCEASLILPFSIKIVSKSIDYLVCESVIVGDVPDTYLNVSSIEELFK
jgi:sporulation protein YunB